MKKLFNLIKVIILTIWSFIYSLFFKNNKKQRKIKKQVLKNENKKQGKIKIIDNLGNVDEPISKDFNKNIITENKVKEIIRKEYKEKNNYPTNNEEVAILENKILEQVKEKVESEEINSIEELKIEIKEQIKNIRINETDSPVKKRENEEEKSVEENVSYVKKTTLKEYFVLEFSDGTYALSDYSLNILTPKFKGKIIDYMDRYLKVFYSNQYFVYDFKGNLLTKNGYLDIRLFKDFYAVINNDYLLDVREYKDPNFKLSSPILLDKMRYQTDYDIKKYISEYKIKVKSCNKTYRADTKGNIFDINSVEQNNEIQSNPISSPTIIEDEIKKEINKEPNFEILNDKPLEYSENIGVRIQDSTIKQELSSKDSINVKTEIFKTLENHNVSEEQIFSYKKDNHDDTRLQEKKESSPEINKFVNDTDQNISDLNDNSIKESKKEELDDKNYEALEEEITLILEKIELKKKLSNNPEDLKKLDNLENKALILRRNIERQKNTDIVKEKESLEDGIHTGELYDLQTELKNVHLAYKQNLNSYALQNIEELNELSIHDANNIEKELLKKELHKANKVAKVANILTLIPLVRNRYFTFFASGMLVKTHLKIYESILKRKTTPYRESNFNNMINGHTALNGGLSLNLRNVNRLNALDEATKAKFPEMAYDEEYQLSMNSLKNSLLSEREKMLKKKKIVAKYNLVKKAMVRERKKAA